MIDTATMEMVCGIAEKALRDVIRDVDMTKPGDAELIKNLVSTMKKADCMIEDGGYSRRDYSRNGNWYADGNYSHTNYDRNSSYRRSGRMHGYSRDGMMEHLDAMMQEAETEEQREKIRRFKEQMM